jgi:hypothetical protein
VLSPSYSYRQWQVALDKSRVSCPFRRRVLAKGEGARVAERELAQVARVYERASKAEAELREARQELRDAMRAARKAGASYAAIGRAAGGITRQRVAEILGE